MGMDTNPPPRATSEDSVGKGFGIGCLTIIVAFVGAGVLGSLIGYGAASMLPHDPTAMLPVQLLLMVLGLAPLVAPIVMALRLRGQGRPLAAKGVWAALLTAVALCVLLAAACFGLLMGADFR
jgi:O-antigen/teichoic acid export membrane protein